MSAGAGDGSDAFLAGVSGPAGVGERLVSPALVGRDGELARVVRAVLATPAVVVVEGESGVGKTRLVEELLGHAGLTGWRKLVGGCRPIREPFPLGAVIEAVRGLGTDLREVVLDPVAGALVPLLPELAPWLPAVLEPLDDRRAERHRVFRGLAELVTALAGTRPLVLVLEDVHWADGQTLEFIDYLLSSPRPGVALVLTYRDDEARAEVSALTARLPRLVGCERVGLGPLDTAGTHELTARILGLESVSAEFAHYLWERTGGLPLAVEEVLALVRARGLLVHQGGRWARRALDELDVPRGIRDPALARVAGLPELARRVVEAAAVLRVPTPPPVLLATTGLAGDPDATTAVERAISSGLLAESEDSVGFRHVLAAEAVYESLSGPRRRELHARAAAALRGISPAPLGRIAHHLKHAADLPAWVDAAVAAADQAISLGHDEEATRLLTEVLAGGPLAPDQRASLAIKLGWAALDTLSAGDVVAPLTAALEQPAPAPQRGELQFVLALALGQAGRDLGRQRSLVAAAVPHLDTRPDLHVWALIAMGILSPSEVPLTEDLRWVHRALAALAGVDDPLVQVFALGKAGSWLVLSGDPAWREVTDRVVRITGDQPRQRREANAYYSLGLAACYAGHLPVAGRLLRKGLYAAAVRDNRRIEMLLRSGLALYRLLSGEWADLAEEAHLLLHELDEYPLARVDVELVLGCLALARGDLGGAAEHLDAATDLVLGTGAYEALPLVAGSAARIAAARGNPATAAPALGLSSDAVEAKSLWPVACWALPSAVEAWVSVGHRDEARRYLRRAEAALGELDAPLAPAALANSRGVLTGSAGDLVAAADLYEAVTAPYEAARASEQAAGLLFGEGQAARAETQLTRALAIYDRLGAGWDHARAVRLARQHGVPLARRHGGGRRSYGTSLSPQEQAVAELAVAGRTNKQIAAELFIHYGTVVKHMSSVMRKVGARSRTELPRLLRNDRNAGTSKNGELAP